MNFNELQKKVERLKRLNDMLQLSKELIIRNDKITLPEESEVYGKSPIRYDLRYIFEAVGEESFAAAFDAFKERLIYDLSVKKEELSHELEAVNITDKGGEKIKIIE